MSVVRLYFTFYINCNILSINSFMTESLSYRNQPIDLQGKSMDLFLHNRDLRHKKVNLGSEFLLSLHYSASILEKYISIKYT